MGATIHARQGLLPGGWHADVRIGIDSGRIVTIAHGVGPQPGDDRHDVVIPGMPNVHSHAFQRGLAGLTEVRGPTGDSFWTWREQMYRFALELSPEQVEAIALLVQVEMLEAGFTRVGEFHYLHHDRGGTPYDDPAEMAARIVSATRESGIQLTLLPVFYAHGGFGGTPTGTRQRRFATDLDQFVDLVDRCRALLAGLDGAVLGIAPHSLRAVTEDELDALPSMVSGAPIHIHIAEQIQEVERCLSWSGQRPVDWLLDHADVDDRWCLIHATHLEIHELNRLGRSRAVVGLCPITEANLGDGVFRGRDYLGASGAFGIGTDSNVQVSLAGELRQLEYSQRMTRRERNVLTGSHIPTARAIHELALEGGSRALGAEPGGIREGVPADLVSLTSDRVDLASGDVAISSWVFTDRVGVDAVWVRGDKVVEAGRHRKREQAVTRFREAMRGLNVIRP